MPIDPWTLAALGTTGAGFLTSLFGRPGESEYQYQRSPWMEEIWNLLRNLPEPEVAQPMMRLATGGIGRERERTAGDIRSLATRRGWMGSPAHTAQLARLGERTSSKLGEAATRAGLAQGQAEQGQKRWQYGTMGTLARTEQEGMNIAALEKLRNEIARNQFWPEVGGGLIGMGGELLGSALSKPDLKWLEDLLKRYQSGESGGSVSPYWLGKFSLGR